MKSKGYRFTVWVLVLSLLVSGATAAAEGNGAIGAGTVSTLFSEEAFSTFLAAAEEGASINLPDSHDTFAFIYNMETESAWAMAWIVNDPMTMYVSYDYVQNEDGQNRITSIMLYHWDAEKGTNGLKLAFHEDGQPEYSMYKIDKIAGEDYDRPVAAVHFAEAEKEFRASPEAFEECWARAEDSGNGN